MAAASTVRVLSALLPLLLTPILLLGLAEGYVDFGAGEKDIFLILPWAVWSLIFAVTALTLWWRRWPLLRSLVCSFLAAVGGTIAAAAILALSGSLGLGAFTA